MDNLNLQTINSFNIQLVSQNVWAIDEFGIDLIYLVQGKSRALVIDTGMGIGNLRSVIETLTSLPYDVVNTHGHIDHAGGNNQFECAYMHREDYKILSRQFSPEKWKHTALKMINDPNFYGHDLIDPDTPQKVPSPIPVEEGHIFDLGERRLEVFLTPGHTPGSIVLLDRKNKLLFAGDTLVSTPILIFDWYSSTVAKYQQALKKLDSLKNEYELIFPGHYLRPIGQIVLRDMQFCAQEILDGSAPKVSIDMSHMSNRKAFIHTHGKASIIYATDKIK